jgi:ATP/maltotriose-dependent transcriptional regulator MalT/DNA-binding SARP family transcriptional activator
MKMATDKYASSPLREISRQDEGVPLNKVTRPLMTGVVDRERLFSGIDDARMRPVLWVAAPGGSGKTTLVASYIESRSLHSLWYQVDSGDTDIATFFHFMEIAANRTMPEPGQPLLRLTPDQFLAIQTFSRRWFETFFASLSRPCTVVFDNFQDATGPLFHDVLYEGLDAVPPGITVIVVSRESPPARFARLQANGRIELLGWEQVRFTLEEAMEFVKARSAEELPVEIVQQLYHKTEGWIAGLLLIMEHARLHGCELSTEGVWTTEGIFNYFAAEVLARMNQESQAFLLATSLFPYIPVSLAETLTGNDRAGCILAEMSRSNYFTSRRTTREAIYQYHQLFQAFLQSQAEEQFGPRDVRQFRSNAAMLFAEAGDTSAAVDLYQKAGEWQNASALVCQQAPTFLAQGRCETVREWLACFPPELLEADPNLLFWQGTSFMALNPLESERQFKKAFALYHQKGNRAGTFLAWACAADLTLQALEFGQAEAWIEALHQLLAEDPSFPDRETEERVTISIFNVMAFKMPDHPDLSRWYDRAYAIFVRGATADATLRLMSGVYLAVYSIWFGNLERAGIAVELLVNAIRKDEIPPLLLQTIRTTEALYCFVTARCDEAVRIAFETVAEAEKTGIHVWTAHIMEHALCAALSADDTTSVDLLMTRIAPYEAEMRRLDQGYFQVILAWQALSKGYLHRALQHQRLGVELFCMTEYLACDGMSHTHLAEIYLEMGDFGEAARTLARGYDVARRMGSKIQEFYCLLIDTQLTQARGDELAALILLGEAMKLARANGYVNSHFWRPAVMARLCALALDAGIETAYVRKLIKMRNLALHAPPSAIEAWPWPVKVYTLGRFELQIDGEPVRFSGKVQKKPLEMLKTLVALGGTEAREGQIAGFLWPDADGDAARSALKVTLHRLRDILGNDRAVQVREGRIALDRDIVWTDVWAFDQLLRSAQLKGDAGDEAGAVSLTEKALDLNRGEFLDEEGDRPWLVSPRKRLKSRYVLHVVALGHLWLQRGDHQRAIACYLRGLELDDLAEELYQNLMECYLAAGLKGEAASVYDRCRKSLAFHGVKPSARTTAIYKTALV